MADDILNRNDAIRQASLRTWTMGAIERTPYFMFLPEYPVWLPEIPHPFCGVTSLPRTVGLTLNTSHNRGGQLVIGLGKVHHERSYIKRQGLLDKGVGRTFASRRESYARTARVRANTRA